MKISTQNTSPGTLGKTSPSFFASVLSALVLSVVLGACAPLFVSSGHQSDVRARLMMSGFGSAADIPVVIPNREWEDQKLQSLTYDFYLGDRQVTQGKVEYDKPINSRSEIKLGVMIDFNETWLLKTPGFAATATAPYRLVGTAIVGGAEVPVSVDGTLWVPGMRPR